MIIDIILDFFVGLLNFALSWLNVVETLPTIGGVSIDNAIITIGQMVRGITFALPFMTPVFIAVTWYMGIKLALFTWSWILWVIGFIRG